MTKRPKKPLKADGRASLLPAMSFLSPVVEYYGLAYRLVTAPGSLDAAAA